MKMSLKKIANALLLTAFSGAMLLTTAHANNPPPTIKADAPNRYIVKKGDTLWDISGRYLDSPWRWKEIWAPNKQIKNPNLIYPNDVLILCVIQGKTLVGVDTGEGCAGVEKQLTGNVVASSVTVTSTANSIPPIPWSAIQHWLDKTIIVNPADFNTTPYILASKKGNLITASGDKVYAKGVPLIVGQRYGIYREGEKYVEPKTQKIIGLEVTQVATGLVTSTETNGVTSLQLIDSYGKEVREGDLFVELNNSIPPVFYPTPATVNRGGMIVRVMDSISSAAKGSVVAINLGSAHGAKPGDVLTVFQKGAVIRDIKDNDTPVRLPSEPTGMVMVFNTFDNISYAYVLDSELPLNVGDQLLPPPYL
ncbi:MULTISPECIES: LysM peptidoglycan-binding domain-containing protein [Psychrobacter]|uniref:LysM peptidoglycan-binding domain-containing protein n=1 Tax=Psychrobacter TaxID=497 RepID=UPI0007F47B51|nr:MULTISPECIES: LysM peptidoglycan-binding domain-containing protein [Psychrobacter]OAP71300.1 peptigoglycan-binding protein LysM [Psychrobacter sp. SHUES1]